MNPKVSMSTTKPSKRNLLPARVKSKMLTNTSPIFSKINFTKGTFNTPIAIKSCNANPIPTVFQLIALLFELNKKEMRISTAIPNAPRHRLFIEKPWLGTNSGVSWIVRSSIMVVSTAALSDSGVSEFCPKV